MKVNQDNSIKRLEGKRQYLKVIKKGKKIENEFFLIFLLPSKESRLGLSITGKIKKSSQRNRIKRLVREVWRLNKKRFGKFDVVIIIKEACINLKNFSQVKEKLLPLITT